MPSKLDADLATIIARAPALRNAGVRSVSVGAIAFELDKPDPPAPVGRDREEPEFDDPLDDPATYGGGKRAPGFEPPSDE